jgi:hypothetical protein
MFKCDEIFLPGHKCKFKVIHLLEREELSDNENNSEGETLPMQYEEEEPTIIITICASNNTTNHSTLQFKDQVGSIDIIAG